MGQNMGQPNRQLSPPNLDLRHIQDHFGFTFSRVALTGFSGGFLRPVFEPSADTRRFSSSAGNLQPRFQHGSKTWVGLFSLTLGRYLHPTPRCRDCTIAFKNCKSFLCPKELPPDGIKRSHLVVTNKTKKSIKTSWYAHFFSLPTQLMWSN